MIKKIAIAAAIILTAIARLAAQDVSFRAEATNNPVHVGERFQVQFSLNESGSDFKGPDFRGLTVLSGPAQSQSIQIAGGRRSISLTYSYILVAEREGEFRIDPATVRVDGNVIKSNPLTISVLPETDAQKQRRQQEEERKRKQQEQVEKIISDNVFIEGKVSKRNVYIGEQVTASYKIYSNPELSLLALDPAKFPEFNGFWNSEIRNEDIGRWKREAKDGKIYNTSQITEVVLFPQRTGDITIEPSVYDAVVRLPVSSRNNSDFPFFNRQYKDFEYSISSDPIIIKVKPLPDGKPESFGGGVGNFTMESWLDKTKTVTGDPVTLRIKISGSGNLNLLEPPLPEVPPGFEMYDPQVIDNSVVSPSGVTGSVTFEYVLLPRNPGEFKINPLEFSYFDLSEKIYKTLSSEEFTVDVGKGSGESGNFVSGVQKENVELIGKDIRFIKPAPANMSKSGRSFFGSFWFWLWILLAIMAATASYIYWKRQNKLKANQSLVKNRRANKIAKKRLKIAQNYLAGAEKEKFYEEITKALWDYLSDKLNIPYSELTKDKAREILAGKNISAETIDLLLNTLDNSEFARYAPSGEAGQMQDTYDDAATVISKIEENLR
jgi:hypothetical protein